MAASDIYIYNYPYLIVPMLFGLGAPPIILDTTFKVFRGGAMVFGAVCDILVPRQTSALAERDGPTLVRATLTAAALCCIPAALGCAVLLLGADKLFAFLLGAAATMPPQTTPILIVLIFANLTQMVCASVLVHNGYFKDVARLGMGVAVAMTAGRRLRAVRPSRHRAVPASLCRGLCLRRARRGGADGPRAVPPRARALGRAGDALGASTLRPRRAPCWRATPQRRRVLDPALEPLQREHGMATSAPRQRRRRDVVVELELGVAPIALVALVADGEIEHRAAALDGVVHEIVQMRRARPEARRPRRRHSSPADDSSGRDRSARD